MEDLTDLKQTIFRYLELNCQGKQNAIKFQNLGTRISLEPIPWRLVAQAVEELRLEGRPIATCAKGAFMPATEDEKKVCLRTIYRRALNTLATVRALEKAFGRQIIEEVNQEFVELHGGQLALKNCNV